MKKQYSAPTLETALLRLANTIATSIPVSGETDDEARSKKFWGPTMFDEEEEETEDFFSDRLF